MRNLKAFVGDLSRKPPLVFPFIALFHLLMLLYTLSNAYSDPTLPLSWTEAGWMLAYTVCWLGCCDMRRWAAIGYVLVVVANIILRFGRTGLELYSSALTLSSIIFGFLVLFFYRRFE